MIARDLNDIVARLESWIRCQPLPDEGEFFALYRDLRRVAAKANMMELGLGPEFIRIAAACNEPDSNVVRFPARPRLIETGAQT